jgi:hypothetical protein
MMRKIPHKFTYIPARKSYPFDHHIVSFKVKWKGEWYGYFENYSIGTFKPFKALRALVLTKHKLLKDIDFAENHNDTITQT